jgi:hypothetical protein
MKLTLRLLLTAIILLCATQSAYSQGSRCIGGLGGQFFTTGGIVQVEILPAEAVFKNFIALAAPRRIDIGTNKQAGKVVTLGAFPAGAELRFEIIVSETGAIFSTGPGSRNIDGQPHAVVQCVGNGVANIGFEDKINSDDLDYDDAVFQVRANPIPAKSDTKFTQSKVNVAFFGTCESGLPGVCLPLVYTWRGSLRVDYDYYFDLARGGNVVFIKRIDQSVLMHNANNVNAPCDIGLGVSTDIYENFGLRYLGTFSRTQPGSYIFPQNALVFGGVTNPNLLVLNPRLVGVARSAAFSPCSGADSFTWSLNLP